MQIEGAEEGPALVSWRLRPRPFARPQMAPVAPSKAENSGFKKCDLVLLTALINNVGKRKKRCENVTIIFVFIERNKQCLGNVE